jgi:hypothetical protein
MVGASGDNISGNIAVNGSWIGRRTGRCSRVEYGTAQKSSFDPRHLERAISQQSLRIPQIFID